jgi:hypothetical protein
MEKPSAVSEKPSAAIVEPSAAIAEPSKVNEQLAMSNGKRTAKDAKTREKKRIGLFLFAFFGFVRG